MSAELIVRLPNHLGDACMSLPALELLAARGHQLTLAGRAWAADLFAGYPWQVVRLRQQQPEQHHQQVQNRVCSIGDEPTIVDLFLEEESQSLAMPSDFIGKSNSMQVESVYTQEQYDIVLM
jgi:hypothetical protein